MIVRIFRCIRRQKAARASASIAFPTAKFEELRDLGMEAIRTQMSAEDMPKIETRLRRKLRMNWRGQPAGATPDPDWPELRAIACVPDIDCVYVFHGDGLIREAALKHLSCPLVAPVQVYGLIWRLNDWAPAVRTSAIAAVERCLPQTSADVIIPALKVVLLHIHSWGRWSRGGPKIVDKLLARPDVAQPFFEEIIQSQGANLSAYFRHLSKSVEIDHMIERAFREAELPHIRAMAFESLMSGKMRWSLPGQQRVWTDRSMGEHRTIPNFGTRDLTVTCDRLACLRLAVKDRSSMVRKRAADYIIALRDDDEFCGDVRELATLLKNDKNIGVRSRMSFYWRQISQSIEG